MMLRAKIKDRYPVMPQSLARELVSVIQQNNFYTLNEDNVALRMTPLLQFLGASGDKRHHVIAKYIRRPPSSPVQDKGHVIGSVVMGQQQRIRFLTPTQKARASATSKSLSVLRHPGQKQARALRQDVRIPTRVIARFGLDDLVSSCPQIPLGVYEEDVLPVSANFRADGNYAIRPRDGGVGMCRLTRTLFEGQGGCVRYILYAQKQKQQKQQEKQLWVLEVQVYCRGVVPPRSQEKHCLFSVRFYGDMAEYTAAFFDERSKLNFPYVPRRVRYTGGDEEEAVLLANLLRAAVRIQKGEKVQMQKKSAEWTDDYYVYPVPYRSGC